MNKVIKKGNILDLYRTDKTVFTNKDAALLWSDNNPNLVKIKLSRYAKAGKLYQVRKGIYAKDKFYNKYELASKIYTPAYISFETVLAQAGVIFQYYERIFIASYLSRVLSIDNQTYEYKKIKNSILTNLSGIEQKGLYFLASPERAFCDVLYLNKEYYFDNLKNINWTKVEELLPIYNNKRMSKKISKYIKKYAEQSKT